MGSITVDWESIKSELGNIHIFETGCGSGELILKLIDFSNDMISSYLGIDIRDRESWNDIMGKHSSIILKKGHSNDILSYIPEETNVFITQSAIEHFDNDLLFF
jgi:hypothetical protein